MTVTVMGVQYGLSRMLSTDLEHIPDFCTSPTFVLRNATFSNSLDVSELAVSETHIPKTTQ